MLLSPDIKNILLLSLISINFLTSSCDGHYVLITVLRCKVAVVDYTDTFPVLMESDDLPSLLY